MAAATIGLDEREPRGIIIRAGSRGAARLPFWAYCWSEASALGACAGAPGGRILETDSLPDGSTPGCRASP